MIQNINNVYDNYFEKVCVFLLEIALQRSGAKKLTRNEQGS